jgi:putative ABC transport system substrate-binding protein
MRRRDFAIALAAAAAGWPPVARAQSTAMPKIGFLNSESRARFSAFLNVFLEGLNETGFAEGKNVAIDYRWAEGENARLPALAAELVNERVDVIAAPGSTPAALAAKRATATIPVVIFTAGDPVELGLVASLSRPGGNVTGSTSLGGDLAPKRIELMHELMPDATVMALLVNPTNPALAGATAKAGQDAARTLGLQLHILRAGTEGELDTAFAALAPLRARGLVIAVDSFFTARREQLAALALRHNVAAIYQYRDFAAAGGVMSYGGTLDGYRMAGIYTGRILKGAKPGDLPMQEITKTELVINLKAARQLGIEVPNLLLARADKVIE